MKLVFIFIFIFISSLVQAEVNYRIPLRDYIHVKGDWNIFYEASMKDSAPKLTRESLAKLKKTLSVIETKLPPHSLTKLKSLNIFLMWGEKSPHGGKNSGMRFVRHGETNYADHYRTHYDKRSEHGVVIYSAENLMYLSDVWTKKAVTHELAHAWHIMHWPEDYYPIVSAWENAKSTKLYTNVKDNKNNIKTEAYALKNNLEYFAELSAIYFVGGDYFPFEKKKLALYDPDGVKMVKKLWSVK